MLTKAWIAILIGLLLGSLLFSSGCGWLGNGYSNNPYYGQPCNYDAPYYSGAPGGAPAGAIPTASGTGGWHSVPATGGTSGSASSPAAGS